MDLAPQIGSKPGNQRPCVAVQPSEFAEAGHPSTVILPLTSRVISSDAYPLRVRIPAGVGGLKRDSDALADQILAWNNSLFRKELGWLPAALQDALRRAMIDILDWASDAVVAAPAADAISSCRGWHRSRGEKISACVRWPGVLTLDFPH